MMRPPTSRCLYASRHTKNWPRVLMLNTRSNSSSVTSLRWPKDTTPELLETMCSFAEVRLGLLEERDRLRHVGDVGLDGDAAAAHGLDLGDDGLGGGRAVGVVDDDVGAAAGELERHLLADAAACGR